MRVIITLLLVLCGSFVCSAKTVEIYTVDKCKYCQEVKTFLKERMVEYKEIALDNDEVWGEMQRRAMKEKATVKKFGKPKKVLVLAPQIFVDDVYFGTHRKASHLQKLGAALGLEVEKSEAAEEESDLLSDDECNTCAKGEVQWEESDEGEVEAMGDGDFEERTQKGLWLVEFYAPWCPHCAKLAPILQQASISQKVKGSMQIVKIDATNNTDIAAKYEATTFPRLFWKRDGVMHRYLGGKKLPDFEKFVQRMIQPAITTEADKISTLQEADVYFKITKPSGAGDSLSKAFDEVALAMQDQLSFAAVEGGKSVVERVQQKSTQVYGGGDNAEELEAWVRDNRFPDVVQLSKANFKEMSKFYRKLLVVGVYSSKEDKDFLQQLQGLALSSVASGDKSQVAVGQLDGVEWIKYVNTMGLYNIHLPQIFILESTKDRSYVKTDLPKTSQEMEKFVRSVLAGDVLPKYSSFSALWLHEGVMGVARQYGILIAGGSTVLVVILAFMWNVAYDEYEDDDEAAAKKNK